MAIEVTPGVLNAVHDARSGCSFVLLGVADPAVGQTGLRSAVRRVAEIRSPDEPTESIVSYSMVGMTSRGPAVYVDFDDVSGSPDQADAIVAALVTGLDEHGVTAVLDVTTESIEPPPRPPDLGWPPEVTFPDDAIERNRAASPTYVTYDCLTSLMPHDLEERYEQSLVGSGWTTAERQAASATRAAVRWDVVTRHFRRDDLSLEIYLERVSLTRPMEMSARDRAEWELRKDRTRLRVAVDHDSSPRRRP